MTRRRPAGTEPAALRRRLLLFSSIVVLAAAAAGAWAWLRPVSFTLPPPGADANVLLVTIDTLRADALGTYGGQAATPNLDALAAAGARFTFAHAHHLLTLPSHASMMTGLYPPSHGVRDNHGYRLAPDAPTIATRLKARGFATGAFVGAFPLDRRFGLASGFDVYDDRVGEGGAAGSFSLAERRADAVVAPALAWITGQQQRWFGWVHVFDPHAPYAAPEEWRARYASNAYAGEIAWTDAALGPLFARLATLTRPTLVIVTADHGEALGDHGELTHGVFAYESTLRVPLIVATIMPGAPAAPRGVIVDAPARHVDLLPTILDVTGSAVDTTIAGTSLRALIEGDAGADRVSYFETWMTHLARDWAPLSGVIAGREKFIELPVPELYDLAGDPGESRNLFETQPERVGVMRALLRGLDAGTPRAPVAESAEVTDRLRSLGYAGRAAPARRRPYTERDDPKQLVAIDRRMQEAVATFDAGRHTEAAAALERVIAERPDNAEAYVSLAVVYWESGQEPRAIDLLERAIADGLDRPDIRAKLGQCLALSGAAARAIPLLEAAPPADLDAMNALGLAYTATGRRADALKTFARLLDIAPSSGLAYENRAALHLKTGDLGAAEDDLRRAIAVDPTLTGARTQLGVVLAKRNRMPEAIDVWIAAADRDSRAYEALYNATIALVQANDVPRARQYAARFLRDAPADRYASQRTQIAEIVGR